MKQSAPSPRPWGLRGSPAAPGCSRPPLPLPQAPDTCPAQHSHLASPGRPCPFPKPLFLFQGSWASRCPLAEQRQEMWGGGGECSGTGAWTRLEFPCLPPPPGCRPLRSKVRPVLPSPGCPSPPFLALLMLNPTLFNSFVLSAYHGLGTPVPQAPRICLFLPHPATLPGAPYKFAGAADPNSTGGA